MRAESRGTAVDSVVPPWMRARLDASRLPFNGFTQEQYAQKMIDEYKAAGVPARNVWPQSFNQPDVLYWVKNEPTFGKQAVYLDDANVEADLPSASDLAGYKADFLRLFGFGVEGVDYEADVATDVAIPNLVDMT